MQNVNKNVHILTPGLDYERFARPLNRDSPPADEVHMYCPPDSSPFPERASEKLQHRLESYDLEVTTHVLDTPEFDAAVDRIYDQLLEELALGNRVYVNTTSGYHPIGTAAATAATIAIGDIAIDDSPVDVEDVHDKVRLYATEPEEYHLDELLDAVSRLETATSREQLDEIERLTNTLQERVREDRNTIQSLSELYGMFDDPAQIGQAFASWIAGNTEDEDIEELSEAAEELFEGIQSVFNGMQSLSTLDVESTLEEAPLPPTVGNSLRGVDDLLTEIENNEREQNQVDAGDMLGYFEQRLSEIDSILTEVGGDLETETSDSLLDRLEEARPGAVSGANGDSRTIFEIVEQEGLARGVQEFDGESYREIPGPLEFDLNQTCKAILYTLYQSDEHRYESVQALSKAVIHDAITNASETDHTLRDDIDLEPIRGSRSPPDSDLIERFLKTVQSTIQYNLGKLAGRGYVKRETTGQKETTVVLREAGRIYLATRDFDSEWRGDAFDKLCGSLSATLDEQ